MKYLFIPVIAASMASFASARAETSVPDLSKYQCYKVDMVGLHISQEDSFAGRGFPHVFAQPSTRSKRLGTTAEIVTVAWPLIRENGFVQILWSQKAAWVAEATLIPLRNADGSVGGCKLTWKQPGRIQMELDPGTAVRY